MLIIYRFDVEDGYVVEEWTERDADDISRRNAIFNVESSLV
jgi:hypothetical protein